MEDFAAPPLAHSMSNSEYMQILARRLMYSRAYTFFYASMIVAGVVELVWILVPGMSGNGFHQLPTSPWFTAVETYVTVGLVCELGLRATLKPTNFCRSPANVFDSVVALVSVLSSLLVAFDLETPTEMLLAEGLITARVGFRLSRLLLLTKGFQRQQQAAYRKLDINLGDTLDLPPLSPILASTDVDQLVEELVISVEQPPGGSGRRTAATAGGPVAS